MLPNIITRTIGDQEINAVDARELHNSLESKKDFSNWVKNRISQLGLSEHEDYEILLAQTGEQVHGGHNRKEYAFSLDVAKHVAMAERTEKGREIRQYFIQRDKQLKVIESVHGYQAIQDSTKNIAAWLKLGDLLNAPRHLTVIEASKHTKKVYGVDIATLLPGSSDMDNIPEDDVFLEPTEAAKVLDIRSAQEFNKIMLQKGCQYNVRGEWAPTERSKGQTQRHAWSSGSKSGYNLKWRLSFCREVLQEEEEEFEDDVEEFKNFYQFPQEQ